MVAIAGYTQSSTLFQIGANLDGFTGVRVFGTGFTYGDSGNGYDDLISGNITSMRIFVAGTVEYVVRNVDTATLAAVLQMLSDWDGNLVTLNPAQAALSLLMGAEITLLASGSLFVAANHMDTLSLIGSDANDTIIGAGGDDTLTGRGGDDVLMTGTGGLDGNDLMDGGAGRDTLFSGVGNDTLYGGAGDDLIYVRAGSDRIFGGAGNDRVLSLTQGGQSGDSITAFLGDGDDTVVGTRGNDFINAGTGHDDIFAGGGSDLIYAGDGDDYIATGAGNDTVHAGHGDDVVFFAQGDSNIYAGSGNDFVGPDSTLSDGAGDTLLIQLGDGADRARVGDSDATIYGGGGMDSITAGSGDNTIYGGDDADTIVVGNGANMVFGGTGADDIVFSEGGTGSLYGGSGDDIVYSDFIYDPDATGAPGTTGYLINMGDGDDAAVGSIADDRLLGGDGNDYLFGSLGNDVLLGGAGLDYLEASEGFNRLFGGADADVFGLIGLGYITVRSYNNIFDFDLAEDVIALSDGTAREQYDAFLLSAVEVMAGAEIAGTLYTDPVTGAQAYLQNVALDDLTIAHFDVSVFDPV